MTKPFLPLTAAENTLVKMLAGTFDADGNYEQADLFRWAREAKAEAYMAVIECADPNHIEVVDFAQATAELIVQEFNCLQF